MESLVNSSTNTSNIGGPAKIPVNMDSKIFICGNLFNNISLNGKWTMVSNQFGIKHHFFRFAYIHS